MQRMKPKRTKIADEVVDVDLDIAESWNAHLLNLKTGNPNKDHCFFIGQVWMGVWKKNEMQSTVEAEEKKMFVEETVFHTVFKCALNLERKMAAKFIHIIAGMVDNKNSAAGHMISTLTSDLLWTVLDASNMVCRFNAASVFFSLYPMPMPESDLGFDIREKQHEVMLDLLKDDCYLIRIGAIKTIFNILSLSWIGINTNNRKEYLATIIDELSRDDCADVRQAIYEYLPLLYSTKSAHNVITHALKIIGPRGLNDPKEKNRVLAVEMLMKAEGKLTTSIYDIVDFEEVLASLDVEVDAAVEEALIKMLLPKIVGTLENSRNPNLLIKSVRNAIAISRNGTMKFFCRLGLKKMVSNDQATTIICSFVVGALTLMGKVDAASDMTVATLNETLMNVGVDFTKIKTMLDSAVLLFASYIPSMGVERDAANYNKSIKAVTSMISAILGDSVSHKFRSTVLAESALTAASFIPLMRVDQNLIKIVAEAVREMPLDDIFLPQYLKTFVMWKMEEFVTMIELGLYDIAKDLNLNHLIPKRRNLLDRNDGFPGNTDKSRNRFKRTIFSLLTGLNYAPANDILVRKFGLNLVKFEKFLTEFVNTMPKLGKKAEEDDFWIQIYELHSILSIICASEASAGNDDFISEADKENADSMDLDTFEKEYIWFDSRFSQGLLTEKFVQKFLCYAAKHFEANQQKASSCDLVVELTNRLAAYADGVEQPLEMRKLIIELKKAALEAAPSAAVDNNDANLSIIREEEEPEPEPMDFEAEESENLIEAPVPVEPSNLVETDLSMQVS